MKKNIPPGTILKLLDFLGIEYKKHVNTHSCICPFHNDKKPSAIVIPEKNIFACTVCGKTLEDKALKIMKKQKDENKKEKNYYFISTKAFALLYGLTEKQWQNFLKNNISKDEIKHSSYQKTEKKTYSLNVNSIWNSSKDFMDPSALLYLRERKINGHILFKKNLIRFLKSSLSKDVDDKKNLLLFFYKNGYKILIPLYSSDGNTIVGIQVRKVPNNRNESLPKAKFIPGSKITLFGLETLKKEQLASFIVEGSTDYLTLKSLGFNNVIGLPSANSLIDENTLKKIPRIIYIFYDKDIPGIRLLNNLKPEIKRKSPDKILIPLNLYSIKKNIKDINDFVTYHGEKESKKLILEAVSSSINKIIKNENKKTQLLNKLPQIL